MKKANKYNLLSKEEPLREKDAKEWVELQETSNWKNKKSENHDTSYMKLDDQISEIENDNLHLSSGNQNLSYLTNSSQKPQKYKQNYQNPQRSNLNYSQNQNNQYKQQQRDRSSTSGIQPHSQPFQQDQRIRQSSQIPSQMPRNVQSSQYNIGPAYVQRSLLPTSFATNHVVPSFGPQIGNYSMVNMPVMYSQYQPQVYSNQPNYQSPYQSNMYQQPMNRSQYQPNPMNSRISQSNQNQSISAPKNSTISRSTVSQLNRSSYRPSIPEMTVNCGKCTFTQSVPGNSHIFICCMCNQIDECFPLYGVFTCGICQAKVIYPHGTSELIKCTKCQTVNRVSAQPKKREEDVAVGKQCTEEQEPIFKSQERSYDESEEKMRRDEPQSKQNDERLPTKFMLKNPDQPFKVLPVKKMEHRDLKQQEQRIYPHIEVLSDQKRFKAQTNRKFSEEFVELSQSSKHNETGNEHLHKEIFELSQKLDQSLILVKHEEKTEIRIDIAHPNQPSSPFKNGGIEQNLNTYPSIFDD